MKAVERKNIVSQQRVEIVRASGEYWNPQHPAIRLTLWFRVNTLYFYGFVDAEGECRIISDTRFYDCDGNPHKQAQWGDFKSTSFNGLYQWIHAGDEIAAFPGCPDSIIKWASEILGIKNTADTAERQKRELRAFTVDKANGQKRKKIKVGLNPDAKVKPDVMAWISDTLVFAVHKSLEENAYQKYVLTHVPSGRMIKGDTEAFPLRFIAAYLDNNAAAYCSENLAEDKETLKEMVARLNEATRLY
jgi:hypothetical protein